MQNRWTEDDRMEIGESGLIPVQDGFIEKKTGNFITTEGVIYDAEGELLYDPMTEEDDRD